MTKNFTLLMLLMASALSIFSKSDFQIQEINVNDLNNTTSKTSIPTYRYEQTDYLVIQPKINTDAYLKENGINVQSYLGNGFYLIASNTTNTHNDLQKINYNKVGYISPASKVDDNLVVSNQTVPVTVLFASSVSTDMINKVCNDLGVNTENVSVSNHHFSAYVSNTQIIALTKIPFVYYITKYYATKNPLLYDGSIMISANQVQEVKPFNYNLKGENINVGIWDEGAPGFHFDLPYNRNFVIDKEYSSAFLSAHATEVAGCVGSGGAIFGPLKGIAPKCNMYFWDVFGDLVNEVRTGKDNYNIDITNHSYNFSATTCIESGSYIPEAADMDKLVYDNPTLLPIIAVGNTGYINCGTITDTFSSVDIGFQGCKNVITVGWLYSNGTIAENSGRGPTTDGRLKPELVAKGWGVQTTVPNNIFQIVYGSSYASPMIAGLTALMYQKYKQQFGTLPNASLIKSILCNTAIDMGRVGPDYTFGFGLPNAEKAVYSLEHNQFFEDNINQNDVKSQVINVPTNTSKLSVTLSWTDKEGNPVADKSLVNDLDLKIVTPNGDTILPWVLNPINYKFPATRGVDKLNNIEQVTISNAIAGNYTVVVKGTVVPFGAQHFSVSYYSQKRKIEITYPNGGEVIDIGQNISIKWLNNSIDSVAKIEYSTDNGNTWKAVVNYIYLHDKNYLWTIPTDAVSNQCLIRIVSGNNADTSDATFTFGAQVYYTSISHVICDKTIKINWPLVSGASAYKIYLFVDSAWVNVGETSSNTFTINNLINGKKYLYSIATIMNGVEGNHSLANQFTPNNNACSTLNDVGVKSMFKQVGGRKFTSSTFTTTEKLSFIIKNFGTTTQNSISVFYKLNNGTTRTATLTDVLTSNDTSIVTFAINENLSAVGNYNIVAWTSLAGDQNTENDTLKYTIRHLPNLPLNLPVSESFEASDNNYGSSMFGIDGVDFVDYYNEQGARFRSNEGNLYANTGNRAITLDNYLGTNIAKTNELIFTYNLSNYTATDSLIYLDFSYMNRDEKDSSDVLYARGNDTKPWVKIYDLYAGKGEIGKYKHVKEINLYQLLKLDNAQPLTASTQLKIVQNGTKEATSPFANGGYTFDDFKLYVAGNDVAITDLIVNKVQCNNNASPQNIKISIKNNTAQPIVNLPVYYSINNATPISELVPIINAHDTLTYTFTTPFNNINPGLYTVKAWVSNNGDNYKLNDSINTSSILILNSINSFPYYNDFETNNGDMLSEGTSNSWVWGTPAKYTINNAAQDNKAWTTSLNKGYNYNENSYLYLGCLDFSTLTTDPIIAFNFISVMQAQSDSAYVEYSTDGTVWKRLGCYNCGLNWYNGYDNKSYWDRLIYPWQVAHTTVSLDSLSNKSNFMYRMHLLSDDFATSDGIGIDDIRIFNDYQNIATTDSGYVNKQSTGNGWIQFYRNGKLAAELHDDNKNLGNIVFGYEANISKQKQFNNSNILPRNWVFKPQNSIVGNYKLRLYLLNDEYKLYILGEDSINRMGDIGLLRYVGLNTNLEVIDNHVRAYYKYFTPQDIQFYPYKDGYFVEFSTDTLGEFYLISTKHDLDAIQSVNLLDFAAQKIEDDVYLSWVTTREVNSKDFVIQYSFDATTFIDIDTVPAGGYSNNITPYNYLHLINATSGIYYYRIKIIDNANNVSYSLIDSVYFNPNVGFNENVTSMNAFMTTNDIVIKFENKLQMPSTINVYNNLGQLQFTKNTTLVNGNNALGISNFNHWSNSAYFLQIKTKDHNYYSKLIKQ